MKTSEKIDLISSALVEASKELGNVDQNAINPYYNSKYATLAHILEITKPVLAKNKLAVIQGADFDEQKNAIIETRIVHESGEWIETKVIFPAYKTSKDGNIIFDAQTSGAAISYGRRYGISAILNIASEEDNDGNELAQEKKTNISFEEVKQNLDKLSTKEEGKEYYLEITGKGLSAKQLTGVNKIFEDWRTKNNI